jgi:hypothetical protein
MTDTEQQLAELAAYHVGLFVGTASRLDVSPAVLAHALFLLVEEANTQRERWLARQWADHGRSARRRPRKRAAASAASPPE